MRKTIMAALIVCAATPALAARDPNLHHMVTSIARAHGVPPQLAHAVVTAESTYNCSARNGKHLGVMQVNPNTARGEGVRGNLLNCRTGLEAGMRYLAKALRMHGQTCAGVSAYNSGVYGRGRCTSYGRKVLAKMRTIQVASR